MNLLYLIGLQMRYYHEADVWYLKGYALAYFECY